jgi:hypothetical protein
MLFNVCRYYIQFKVAACIITTILFYLYIIFHLNFNAYAFFNQLCDTYPRYLYVPSSASTTVLLGSSRFRSKGRLPVLSYLHRNKVMFKTYALNGFLNSKIYVRIDVGEILLIIIRNWCNFSARNVHNSPATI